MSKRCKWGALGLSIIGLCSSLTMAAPVSGLDEAVRLAITQNPDVKASWHRFEASVDAVRAAEGGYYPRVDLEGSVGHERQDPDNLPSFSYDPWRAQLSLTQMLFDGFETRSQVSRFDHERKRLYYDFRQDSEEAALEATRAYLDVRRFQQLLELAKENYIQHRTIYRDIEKRAQAGVGRKVDVEQASARLALAETNLLTEATNLHDVSARFQRVVGELPADELPVPEIAADAIPIASTAALKAAYAQSPRLLSAVENTQVAQAAREGRDAPLKPRVDLRLRHEMEDNTDGVSVQRDTSAIELVLSYNLYRGGSDKARIREADHLLEEAFEQQRKACRDVRQELVIAHNDIGSINEQLRYLNRNQLAVGKARTQYRKQFDIGKRTLLDLLDTENEYFDVRRSYVTGQHNLLLAQARTLAAMGGLVGHYRSSGSGLSDGTAVPAASRAPDGRCPQEALPMMSAFDKQALLASVLDEPDFRDIGNNKLAFRMNAHFGYDSVKLNNRYEPDISRAAQFLKRYPDVNATIEGHTDNRGSERYNQHLSERRAQAVFERLVEQYGIAPQRLNVKGYGESRPMATNKTRAGRGLNRRVDLVIEKPRSLEQREASRPAIVDVPVATRLAGGFNYNAAELSAHLSTQVAQAARWLADNPALVVSIEGHTDSRGSTGYNQQLSEQRARMVFTQLVKRHGIDASRLKVVGYGEGKPLADNSSAQGRAQNRRVELIVQQV